MLCAGATQPIVAIAAGQHHALGLDDSGRVLTLGRGDTGRLGHGDTAELSECVPKPWLVD